MRPRSMTGYGYGERVVAARSWSAEIRTVNHRFLDLRITLPRTFVSLEERVRKLVSAYSDRGRVEVTIQQQGVGLSEQRLFADLELATQYFSCLKAINEELRLGDDIKLSDILGMRDIIGQQEQIPDVDSEWILISGALTEALDACNRMRDQEGQALKQELLDRLSNFALKVGEIEEMAPQLQEQRQHELKNRISRLLEGVDLDPVRLAQEVAIIADKSDITEELVRLRSHIAQFRDFLDSTEPVGRRLDFLLQEFLREVNTLASKINNGSIAHLAVEMKNEVEKLREQVQNIE
jgi:uncharacterized protein (TIGR00255 family)